MQSTIQHVFWVGAKPFVVYGGCETFINKLTEYLQNNEKIKYRVATKANGSCCMDLYKTEGVEMMDKHRFIYHNAECFRIRVPEKICPTQPICYDVVAPKECCGIIRMQRIQHPIVYIMACRIGPLIKHYYKKIHKLGGWIFLNPDRACEIIGPAGENSTKSGFMSALFSISTQIQSISKENHAPVFSKGSVLCWNCQGIYSGPFSVGMI